MKYVFPAFDYNIISKNFKTSSKINRMSELLAVEIYTFRNRITRRKLTFSNCIQYK